MRDEVMEWLETLTVEQITGDAIDLVRLAWDESARRERERCAKVIESSEFFKVSPYYGNEVAMAIRLL